MRPSNTPMKHNEKASDECMIGGSSHEVGYSHRYNWSASFEWQIDNYQAAHLVKLDILTNISGVTLLIPSITRVITHLLSGMSHHV